VFQIKGWGGGGVTPSTVGYTSELDPRPFDPDNKARQLLADAFLLGLVARLGYILVAAGSMPLKAEPVGLRVLAGEEGHAKFHLQNETPLSLRVALSSPAPWVRLPRQEIDIGAGAAEDIEVAATPPLAGPTQPAIQALLLDPWGFLFWGIDIYPLRLHVIPRAWYAAWLARRYLV
jgi:hypothetical protein